VDSGLLEEVLEEAKALARRELAPLLGRSRYYGLALRALAQGLERWVEVKRAVEAWLGRPLTSTQLGRTLTTLVKLGLVEKRYGRYFVLDPVVRELAREL
jgi:DNA-binding HxlR family transcriptional regulator